MENNKSKNDAINRVRLCKTYYEILGVAEGCSNIDIKKAFRTLAVALHPDKNRSPGATEAFKTINTAMEILTNANRRRSYDIELRKSREKEEREKKEREEKEREREREKERDLRRKQTPMSRYEEFEQRRLERECQEKELEELRKETQRVQRDHEMFFKAWKDKLDNYLHVNFSNYSSHTTQSADTIGSEENIHHVSSMPSSSYKYCSNCSMRFEPPDRKEFLATDWPEELLALYNQLELEMRSSVAKTNFTEYDMNVIYEVYGLPSCRCRWKSPNDTRVTRLFRCSRKSFKSTISDSISKNFFNFFPTDLFSNMFQSNETTYNRYESVSQDNLFSGLFNKLSTVRLVLICCIGTIVFSWWFI